MSGAVRTVEQLLIAVHHGWTRAGGVGEVPVNPFGRAPGDGIHNGGEPQALLAGRAVERGEPRQVLGCDVAGADHGD